MLLSVTAWCSDLPLQIAAKASWALACCGTPAPQQLQLNITAMCFLPISSSIHRRSIKHGRLHMCNQVDNMQLSASWGKGGSVIPLAVKEALRCTKASHVAAEMQGSRCMSAKRAAHHAL